MPEMHPVNSSNISHVGYDRDTRELHVQWPGGKVSIYEDVDPQTAERVRVAPSVRRALNELVIPNSNHRYR